jgi:hypothetical protein
LRRYTTAAALDAAERAATDAGERAAAESRQLAAQLQDTDRSAALIGRRADALQVTLEKGQVAASAVGTDG